MRLGALQGAIILNQIHSFQRNIQPHVIGILQAHEFTAAAIALDRLQPLELPDSVVHVHHVIAGFELAEITEETCSLWALPRPFVRRCGLEEIAGAVESQLRLRDYKSLRQRGAKQDGSRSTSRGDFLDKSRAGRALFEFSQAIRDIIFTAKVGEPLELAGTGGGDQDFVAGAEPSSNLPQKCLNLSVIPRGWLNLECAGIPAVPVQWQFLQAKPLLAIERFLPLVFWQNERNRSISGE